MKNNIIQIEKDKLDISEFGRFKKDQQAQDNAFQTSQYRQSKDLNTLRQYVERYMPIQVQKQIYTSLENALEKD